MSDSSTSSNKDSETNFDGTTQACPACQSKSILRDYEKSIKICNDCGFVIKQEIKDRGPEWRAFNQEQKEERSRGGAPMTYTIHDKGLSTKIDHRNRDGKGNNLSPEKRSQMHRLRKWQRRSRISQPEERNLAYALTEIDRMASQLAIPEKACETSSMIYRAAVRKGLIRGRSIEGVSSAALYAGCRKCDIPRTLDEIAQSSRVDKKEVSRSYRFIARELNINLSPTSPTAFVARFGSKLDIKGKTRTKAIEIIKKAEEEKLTVGRGPTGIAAAALYLACRITGERRTQKETADAANVTEVTVRNRYQEIADVLDLEIDL